jgi:ATP phosphoribosyltransferase
LAPLVGLADMIVDIVETGTTMKQNGLEVVEEIMTSSTYLIANKNSYFEKKSEVLDIFEKISSLID